MELSFKFSTLLKVTFLILKTSNLKTALRIEVKVKVMLILSVPTQEEIMSKSESIPTLTSESAILILNKTIDVLQTPENLKKLEEARDNVGNEMLKMMQFLFPIVMQIQMDVIKEFGYPTGRDGIIKFAQMLRSLEREDLEVARLHASIKAYYLPPISVNAASESPAEDRTSSS